jgi:dihydropteroate synthase
VRIVGVVNITEDSFSDGGRYLDPEAAIAHARRLRSHGADVVELGAASSHPDATHAETQRLALATLAAERHAARAGVDYIRTHDVRAPTVERALRQ